MILLFVDGQTCYKNCMSNSISYTFAIPADHEKPDFNRGLPMYNAQRRIVAYNSTPAAQNYLPMVVNGHVCGWIGPLDDHHLSQG